MSMCIGFQLETYISLGLSGQCSKFKLKFVFHKNFAVVANPRPMSHICHAHHLLIKKTKQETKQNITKLTSKPS